VQNLILVHYESLEGCMNEKKIEKSEKKKEVVCIELQKRKLKKKGKKSGKQKRKRREFAGLIVQFLQKYNLHLFFSHFFIAPSLLFGF